MLVCSFRGWKIVCIDITAECLQISPIFCNMCAISPVECRRRNQLWIFIAAKYGLVNFNAKWQV